jgi:hypothetical protein
MKKFLFELFTIILLSMLVVTFMASLQRSVFQAGKGLWPGPWFLATLLDAYLGFIIIYVWGVYKERTAALRNLWFILIMGLGNMTVALFVLIQ